MTGNHRLFDCRKRQIDFVRAMACTIGEKKRRRKMKWNKYVFSALGVGLLCGAGALRIQAQEPPAGPPPGVGPDAMMPDGPIGRRMEILGFGEMHPGAVVTGAPYTAVAVVESKQILADGNTIDRRAQTNVFRDSQGRTRRETTLPAVGPLAASGQPKTFILIFDPVASTSFVLHPDTKIAEKLPARVGGEKNNPGGFQAKFEARMQQEIANGTLKKDDLGVQTINGISAQGTRYTHTIPAGQMGNEKAIVVTSERWYSPDLQIVVKTTRNDPRFGETSYVLTSIQRQEPAATLFAVPAGYTVQAGRPHMLGRGAQGPGGPPPAGDEAAAPAPPPPGE
jgi:hypothetical protein